MHHLLRLADECQLRVVERTGRTRGGFDPATRTIRLNPGMSARTTRSVLAHELGHATLGHVALGHDALGHVALGHDALGHDPSSTPAIRRIQERQADEWAAARLLTPSAYAAAEETRGPHLASLAFELDVTIELVIAYQRLLRETLLVAG
ncbi:ImmA/IrrE family metallo-endopeptidase [Microbacterium sp. NPDC076768]|uniref:ImmA/IrrE family metallo-endopeptidase n=1 Tax=Microbacterium sp. NPDC076768 TaxID=3154858 RepID=UPI0034490404